jgi:dTDP-4-amino-4,6-dideoxygalactose transaminase
MIRIEAIPRRCVNLPPGTLRALAQCVWCNEVSSGPALDAFCKGFAQWLGVPHVFGAAAGRSAFQLALEALALTPGAEIIFPSLTFPVIPLVAQRMGYRPVFCDIDPETFNAGPEQIAPVITERTAAIVATHLFGQPCPIDGVVALARQRGIRVLEDCAHACGVRMNGRQVGTFGDVGVFSFAEGKNMPCFGGGAIATADDAIAKRAEKLLSKAPLPSTRTALATAFSIWMKWLLTRPAVFALTAYPMLRLKLALGQSLMDAEVGDELLEEFAQSQPRIVRMSNLQAKMGLLQLEHIDAFNSGAQRNAELLTKALGEVPGITTPRTTHGQHIYVYYPITMDPARRDDLRHFLLRHGIDVKTTDMADCPALNAFRGVDETNTAQRRPGEASFLEICVYPIISEPGIRRIAQHIRRWADVST